jgi:hypothetical protein
METDAFARLALDCIERPYPNKLAHVLAGPHDARPPDELTPAFYGCFDWHSAVHGHWLLVRLLRATPDAAWADDARAALARNLTAANLAGELAYLSRADRVGFERPYGLAWLLQLAAEIRRWAAPEAMAYATGLAPLEQLAAQRLLSWAEALSYPVRSGEHSCSGFAFALALDWARDTGQAPYARRLAARVRALYRDDRGYSFALEPSGQDYLSPSLAAADLMRRVLSSDELASWLDGALPDLADGRRALVPAVPSTRHDGKLVHLDGLNLSRAWMLQGIAGGLPRGDRRIASLLASAAAHRTAGLAAIADTPYEGGHWLGSFAVYSGA